jgi:WD40 repeat protein
MKRVAKLLKRRSTRDPTKKNSFESSTTTPIIQQHVVVVPLIPTSVLVDQILPFLDRVSQNRLCATCQEIYHAGRRRGRGRRRQQHHHQQQQHQQQTSGNPYYDFRWPDARFHVGRPIIAVSFASTGNSLAVVVGNSRKISIWNRRRGKCQKLVGHAGIVSNVAFAPTTERELLASSSRTDGTIRLWTTSTSTHDDDDDDDDEQEEEKSTFTCLRVLNIRVFGLKYILFSPASTEIASWGYDGTIRLNAVEDAHFYGSTDWRNNVVVGLKCFHAVAFSRQQRGLIAHSFNNQKVRLWNSETQHTVELFDQDQRIATRRPSDYAAFVTSIAFISDPTAMYKEYLVVGCRVARIKFWDLSNFTCIRTIQLGSGWSGVTHLVVSDDGRHFSCTGEGSQIRVFRVSDGENVATYKEHKDRVQSMAIAPDGTIASGGCDRMLQLRNIHFLAQPATSTQQPAR